MTDASDPPASSGSAPDAHPATIVFLAAVAGAVLTVLLLAVIGPLGIVAPIPDLPLTVLRIGGGVVLVAGFALTGMLSGSIRPCRPDQHKHEWWQENSGKAIVAWAAAEALAIVGGVLFLLTADPVLLAGLGGGGLVVLVLNHPGRLMEG